MTPPTYSQESSALLAFLTELGVVPPEGMTLQEHLAAVLERTELQGLTLLLFGPEDTTVSWVLVRPMRAEVSFLMGLIYQGMELAPVLSHLIEEVPNPMN
jgi:hypothetical protein